MFLFSGRLRPFIFYCFCAVLKLLKMAKGIRSLLDTVMQALPQVDNLGLLFYLLFSIFAALGVELFGRLCKYKHRVVILPMKETRLNLLLLSCLFVTRYLGPTTTFCRMQRRSSVPRTGRTCPLCQLWHRLFFYFVPRRYRRQLERHYEGHLTRKLR